ETDVVVLALPRGGVPVAFEVARALRAPLDVLVARKLGVPGQEELAFGAIASGGGRVLNEVLVRALRLSDETIERITDRERAELKRREEAYRGNAPSPELKDKTVILIDDGLATGATMRAAVEAVKLLGPKQVVVAVPVGSADTCAGIEEKADVLCICARTPEPFYGVGLWYRDFSQTTDEEVEDLLRRAGELVKTTNAGL
ncbi:MAG: phosphoribosyltransferase, partial [Pyrinomonadaceae bacterium]|nr:phosphoribosyltransferase [Pyrinomonadaceae bacterium]